MDVLERIRQVYTGDDLSLCERAYDYAKKAHANQKRASGEEYFTHPCAVASILIDLGLDAPTIAAAFLHDVIEDTPVSEGDVRQEFGDEVLELVLGVTKLEKIEFTSQEEEQAENFRKIFVAMAKDIRVIIIKLADRLHNMRSLNFLSKERQQRLAARRWISLRRWPVGWASARSNASWKISLSNIWSRNFLNFWSSTSIRRSRNGGSSWISWSRRSTGSWWNRASRERCSAAPSIFTPSTRR